MQLKRLLGRNWEWLAECEFCGHEQMIGVGGELALIRCDCCHHSRNDPPKPCTKLDKPNDGQLP